MEPIVDVMIDIETAGTKPGSAILQVAAVPFNSEVLLGDNFYQGASLESCTRVGLTVDFSTLEWWEKQPAELKEKVFGSKQDIRDTLECFYLWYKSLPGATRVWGNGANFDIVLLEAAFAACKVPVPWHYRNIMCYRTLTALFPLPPLRTNTIKPNLQRHDALGDAEYQAGVLIETHNYISESSNGLFRIL